MTAQQISRRSTERVVPDVNFFVDACRGCDTLEKALARNNETMRFLFGMRNRQRMAQRVGVPDGVEVHTGPHLLDGVEIVLTRDEGWSQTDARRFRSAVEQLITECGWRTDVSPGVSHKEARRRVDSGAGEGAPDWEDYMALSTADQANATAFVTKDKGILSQRRFRTVKVWSSEQLISAVRTNHRKVMESLRELGHSAR